MLLGSEPNEIPVYYPPDHHKLSPSAIFSDEPVELCGVFFPEAAHAPMRVPATVSGISTPVARPRSLFFNTNDRAMTGARQSPPPPSLSSTPPRSQILLTDTPMRRYDRRSQEAEQGWTDSDRRSGRLLLS